MTWRTCGGAAPQRSTRHSIERLLFIADSAVAEVTDLPPVVRTVIENAAEIYVLTPTLPGRLAWLADDVDGFRHVADERLDAVLGHLRTIGAHASGLAARGSVPLVIADAVAEFKPTHVLVALRSPEHANWQERGIGERIEERFRLPVTTYTVDRAGHTPTAEGPLLLCYDGSDAAAHAIERAGELFAGGHAIVVVVWQSAGPLGGLAWADALLGTDTFVEANRAAVDHARRLADAGVRIAEEAGLKAKPAPVKDTGTVSATILEIADRHDAATIVLGSRGPTGVHSILLGRVSSAVVHGAARPALIIPHLALDP